MANPSGVPKKYLTDLVGSSDVRFALINDQAISKCSSIANFSICTSFVYTDALIADTLTLKAQMWIYLQTTALAF